MMDWASMLGWAESRSKSRESQSRPCTSSRYGFIRGLVATLSGNTVRGTPPCH